MKTGIEQRSNHEIEARKAEFGTSVLTEGQNGGDKMYTKAEVEKFLIGVEQYMCCPDPGPIDPG